MADPLLLAELRDAWLLWFSFSRLNNLIEMFWAPPFLAGHADSSELSSFSDLSSITGDTIFVVLCLLSRELDPGSLEP